MVCIYIIYGVYIYIYMWCIYIQYYIHIILYHDLMVSNGVKTF